MGKKIPKVISSEIHSSYCGLRSSTTAPRPGFTYYSCFLSARKSRRYIRMQVEGALAPQYHKESIGKKWQISRKLRFLKDAFLGDDDV